VSDLATSISRKTGMDDEAIQSGENLLLTFTNIHNETGRGNQIFTRATRTIADMSAALGQDTKSSAIQLGKALNDPIKGVTALQRVGVSFTQSQRDQIKTLVESGNTLDAQKMILRELRKEFGGSAPLSRHRSTS
jgi:phage-related minor tail protein